MNSNEQGERDALAELNEDPSLEQRQFQHPVRGGIVTVRGMSGSSLEELPDGQAAENVEAVAELITFSPPSNEGDIEQRIKRALKRSAEVDAAGVQVDVEGTTLTLGGSVRSWAEREQALEAASALPGIKRVRDEMVVDS